MEKEIISRENIKPSSPTPPHLKSHNLSLLDLLEPPIYVPMILYFPADDPHNSNINDHEFIISQKSQRLKKSLSSTLTRYYPLAGILSNDGKSVDCNDQGVPFIVSRMKCDLLEFTANKYRLHDLNWTFASPGSNVTGIHVNFFDCGGMVITSLFLHTVTDGVTMGTFMKAWGASSSAREDGNGNNITVPSSPSYNAATLFPHNNEALHMEPNIGSAMCSYLKMGKIMRRPYVFTSSAISTLRTKLMEGGSPLGFRPSRVEIVSALIWKCFIIATSSTSACRRPVSTSTMAHTVNLRRKADPPIPEHSFGNHCWYAPASTNQTTTDVDLKDLVLKMRNSLSKIDSDFVRRMEAGTGEGFSGYLQNLEEFLKEFPHDNNAGEFLLYSSWCNFGLYDIDFGWGKPIWITGTNANEDKEILSMNSVLLIDTKERDGIEAWVCIDERYFEAFDRVEELQQALAALDPLPQQNVA